MNELLAMNSDEPVRSLEIPIGRPQTINGERRGSRWERAEHTRQWREATAVLARADGGFPRPFKNRVVIAASPVYQSRRSWPDVAGTAPSTKAAVDGLVDAGVLVDDGPEYLAALVFLSPMLGEFDGLVLYVQEVGS